MAKTRIYLEPTVAQEKDFDIKNVEYVEKYVLDISFRDGSTKRVDFQGTVGYAFNFDGFRECLDWNEDAITFNNGKIKVEIFGTSIYGAK